ncbi:MULTISPECIES: hypothetical protein [unclassified Halanaerobium]|uniref:hypothetical protein n=1 Tax=unclassified Halanaerobium TaxID=2641197 RepID=UPI000DF3271E|nr:MULTISPECIES: hypothetical protein [unclassified Halanaerobium]RCW47670.1 hypothetical protein DFR78_11212 [Halanaerobium sp. MA284_MarDTE_T2]RCW84686.1 hypothetical protein DER71_11355 [Halanaerobium sp. DL-01]
MLFKSILFGFIFYVLNTIYYLINKMELKTVFFKSINRTIIFVLIFNLIFLLTSILKDRSSKNSSDLSNESKDKNQSDTKESDEGNAEDDGFSPINPPEIEYTQRED